MTFMRVVKKTLFDMLFVMTDGAARPSKSAFRKVVILYTIDLLQVIRVMLSPAYGWSGSTYNIAKHVDLVYNGVALVSIFVPRYTFFVIAFLLVAFAIGDAMYCARLFYNNEINTIGPIKVLRFMVTTLVTTLFSSVIKWILIPLECQTAVDGSGHLKKGLSAVIHGDPERCTPWSLPEIIISVPTVLIATMYMGFAVIASYFSLEPNCLSCHPNAKFTGHVEVLFVLTKIATTCLVYAADGVSPLATSCVILLLTFMLLYRHLSVLPFHLHATNLFRGGIYGVVCWLGICNVLVSIINQLRVEDDFWRHTLAFSSEWILLACIPISFPIGMALVQQQRSKTLLSIDRLRGEWEAQAIAEKGLSAGPDGQQRRRRMSIEMMENMPNQGVLRTHAKKRSRYDDFFDPSWERKRAFSSGSQALTVSRLLLYQREETDLPLLNYIVSRALEEFPNSQTLKLFRLSLLRFVFRNTTEATIEEKKLRNGNVALASDNAYVLYAVERKASQECATNTMGKGGVFNAINLMEFESGMMQAKGYHMEAVEEMKMFWQTVAKDLTDKPYPIWLAYVEESISRLIESDKALTKAKHEYHALLEKYPQSVQLLYSYASFCDVALNDHAQGDERRRQAALLEGLDDEAENETAEEQTENDPEHLEEGMKQSMASGETGEDAHGPQIKTFLSWSSQIFGDESRMLVNWNFRLQISLGLLGVLSVAGFCCMQFWLFQISAARELEVVNESGIMRTWIISIGYLLRSQMLAASRNDTAAFDALSQQVSETAMSFKTRFRSSYMEADGYGLRDRFLEKKYNVSMPFPSGWRTEHVDLWKLGNEWTVRIERASQGSMNEFADLDFSPLRLEDSKAGVQFINEQMFRLLLPAFEEMVMWYQGGAAELWWLTQTVMTVIAVTEGVMQLVIATIMLLALTRTMQKIQHLYLGTVFALSVNPVSVKGFCRFYRLALHDIRSKAENRDQDPSSDAVEEDFASQACPQSPSRRANLSPPLAPKLVKQDSTLGPEITDSEQAHWNCGRDIPSRIPSADRTSSAQSSVARLTQGNLSRFERQQGSFMSPRSDAGILRRPAAELDRSSTTHAVRQPSVELDTFEHDSAAPEEEAGEAEQDASSPEHGAQGLTAPAVPGQVAEACEDCSIQRVSGTAFHLESSEPQSGSEADEEIKRKVNSILGMEQCEAASPGQPEVGLGAIALQEQDEITPAASALEPTEAQAKPPPPGLPKRSLLRGAAGFETLQTDRSLLSAEPAPVRGKQTANANSQEQAHPGPPAVAMPGRAAVTFRSANQQCMETASVPPERSTSSGFMDMMKRIGSGVGLVKQEEDNCKRVLWDEDVQILPSNHLSEDQKRAVWRLLRRHQPLVLRWEVSTLSLLLVIGLCILNATFPARRVGELVNLSPTINQAGRRRTLTRACIHLSRELVLDDGYSRMHKADMISGLGYYLDELRRVDDAVRLGGDLGIETGADHLYTRHNRVMYQIGCPWRETAQSKEANVSACMTPERPGVASQGLHHLFIAFTQSVETLLLREGAEAGGIPDTEEFLRNPRTQDQLNAFDLVDPHENLGEVLEGDLDLDFILSMYEGDLYQGLEMIVSDLDHEFRSLIEDAQTSNRTLFIFYILALYGVLYWLVFSKARWAATLEVKRARNFVARLPVQTLSKLERDTIDHMFATQFYT